MAAIIKVVPKDGWEILSKYLMDEDGVILIPEKFYGELSMDTKEKFKESSDKYDFGGKSDVAVEIVTNKEHYLFIN